MVSKLRDRKNARLGIIILVLCSVMMSRMQIIYLVVSPPWMKIKVGLLSSGQSPYGAQTDSVSGSGQPPQR